MKQLFFYFLLSFLAACSGTTNQSPEQPAAHQIETDTEETAGSLEKTATAADTSSLTGRSTNEAALPLPVQKEYLSGKVTYQIENGENQRGSAMVKVTGTDPAFSKEFPVAGRIEESFLLDLNKDGFSEFYFTVASSEGQIDLKGIASYRDRSAGEIYVNDAKLARQPGTVRFFVENGALYRSFSKPDGTAQKVKYELKKGETSFILSPIKAGQ